jgi:hypothetical protein
MKLISTLRLLVIPMALLFASGANAQIGSSTTNTNGNVQIWPVPFTSHLTVKVGGLTTNNMDISVYNSRQSVVANYAGPFTEQHTMNMAAVPPGQYTIIVMERGRTIAKKMIMK